MGHRKYSAPRRGSLAFNPRSRAKSLESRIRTWPSLENKPSLIGFAGFKVGGIQVMTVDDHEKTPNFGKPLLNPSTVIVTPPITIIGIRGYKKNVYGNHVIFDVYAKEFPKEISRKTTIKFKEDAIEKSETLIDSITSIVAIVSVTPSDVGLSQKKPFVFEINVSGNNNKEKFEYLKTILGKQVRINEVFHVGQLMDVSAITRGKGVEGPITRFGVKRKQHKSRKSVRALGTLGPISPAVVMYTVPRQGQHGFHQRTEYNKRILIMSNTEKENEIGINPSGGFKHFGIIKGDFIVVRGSIPGVPKRLIKLRYPLRSSQKKIQEPKILEMMI